MTIETEVAAPIDRTQFEHHFGRWTLGIFRGECDVEVWERLGRSPTDDEMFAAICRKIRTRLATKTDPHMTVCDDVLYRFLASSKLTAEEQAFIDWLRGKIFWRQKISPPERDNKPNIWTQDIREVGRRLIEWLDRPF